MTEVKSYCCADAMALIALTPASASEEELKGLLVAASEVPADRIDACFAELVAADMFSTARGMALVVRMASGEEPTVAAMRECFQSVIWNDDSNNKTTMNMTVMTEEDDPHPTKVTITKTY